MGRCEQGPWYVRHEWEKPKWLQENSPSFQGRMTWVQRRSFFIWSGDNNSPRQLR